MNIWEADKLLIFIAFVIPGFISIKTYELLFPGAQQESSKQLVDAVTYSSLNYALLVWPMMAVESSDWKNLHPNFYAVFYMFVLFAVPVGLGLGWAMLRTSSWFQNVATHPTQKPWDYVFSQRKPYWVKVVLKDGTKLGGKYAANSFASSTPANEQIFLEESWIINDKGGFDRPKNQTAGIVVISSEIAYLELIELQFPEGKLDERKETTDGGVST